MPYLLEIDTPADVLDAVADQLRRNKSRSLMVQNFRKEIRPVETWVINELSTQPPPAKKPIQWKSIKQRKAYFASNGFGKGIPYKRTGTLSQGWRASFRLVTQREGQWALSNQTPYTRFVQGDDAQPFHLNTGWPQANDVLPELNVRVENATINAWFATAETIALGG